ncbi:kinase-like protein [Basidiobolus meristosporus CBS 931.73]|uniref:non-specific serine/threonine protein kinase n=1 Tax=Basidiobolus meristosporus CBS 931.73 TaxID=1314790 RepID=A0A1Y1Z3K4_9FUNG|nr:kinase-like protein [Basidiobolus meristosporus CBS 931.73]|eukprot:ORY04799.1 kinase-like protein [Basidiobolus meristosporus CBS 931.73]
MSTQEVDRIARDMNYNSLQELLSALPTTPEDRPNSNKVERDSARNRAVGNAAAQRSRPTSMFEGVGSGSLLSNVSPATKRKCVTAQVYFLEYYFDLLTYIHKRKMRLEKFKLDAAHQEWSPEEKAGEWKRYCGKERVYLRKRRTRTRVTHFHILTQVGQGGYGQVFLARKKDTGEICALKKMNKKLLYRHNEIQHILTERDVLTSANSPWLVSLLYAFQDIDNVYLAMEYVPGGDLRTLLNNNGCIAEEYTSFYIAEIVMAVSALHQLGYIHRDLKPENFLIDAAGHIKLTDFGLSTGSISPLKIESLRAKLEAVKDKQVVHRTPVERRSIHRSVRREYIDWAYSLVGSADYMAPEILENIGYDFLVDYWSIGCIMFEFLAGYAPFTAPSMEEVWGNVYHWDEVLERPQFEDGEELSDESWDLITKLITYRDQRYSTVSQIQSHPFFAQLDWDHLRDIKNPPFVPQLESEEDVSHFDDFNNPDDMEMYKDVHLKQQQLEESLTGKDASERLPRSTFVGFTFQHKDQKAWIAKKEQLASTPQEEFGTMF